MDNVAIFEYTGIPYYCTTAQHYRTGIMCNDVLLFV